MMGSPKLIALTDGRLRAAQAVDLPFMAPRLQGQWAADGQLTLALWGAGDIATLRLDPMAGVATYAPNQVATAGQQLHVARSAPALVVRGGRLKSIIPARRRARWDHVAHAAPELSRDAASRRLDLAWASLVVEQRGDDLVIAVGADVEELRAALALDAAAIRAEAAAHALACDLLQSADPVLRSMVLQGAHTGLTSIRRDARGHFAGLAAGLAYSAPARTYFRDGYWTAQILLRLNPEAVRLQIDLLSDAVQDDGEAPSGVIVEDDRDASWEARRAQRSSTHRRRLDWWSDHFDSPLFFILLMGDYARVTGDIEPARRHWPQLRAILERYDRFARPGGLPMKPFHDRDWADNVFRSGLVAYDLGLWIGALRAAATLGAQIEPAFAELCRARAQTAGPRIEAALWTGAWFADYAPPDAPPDTHLTLDSLTLLRFDAVSPARATAVLRAMGESLESRCNGAQRWGDWGVMCVFPPFLHRTHLRAKSAFAYRYHNGADWPWLDGLYAGERLRRGLGGWRYPLTRWWEISLEQGWAGPVEYFSPPFTRGGLLQGWSSLPACVALDHADRVLAGDPGP